MTALDPTTNWLRTLIARVAPTHRIELRCTVDGCAAMHLGPLLPEWSADPVTGSVLCPQHVEEAVRALVDEITDAAEPLLEDDDAISPPLSTLGPEIAASLDSADQVALDALPPAQRDELDRMARGEPVEAISLDGIDQSDPEPTEEPVLTEDNGSMGFYSETTLAGGEE